MGTDSGCSGRFAKRAEYRFVRDQGIDHACLSFGSAIMPRPAAVFETPRGMLCRFSIPRGTSMHDQGFDDLQERLADVRARGAGRPPTAGQHTQT